MGSLLWTFAPPVLGFLDGGLVDFVESSALLMIRPRWCIPSQQLGLLCTAKFKRTKKLHKSTNYHSTVAYNFKCGQSLNSHWFPMLRDRHQVNIRARFGISFPLFVVQMWSNWEPFAFSLDQLDMPGGLFGSSLSFPNHQDICDQRPGAPWKGRRSQGRNRSEVSSRSFMGAPNDFWRLVLKMLRVPCFWDHVSFFLWKIHQDVEWPNLAQFDCNSSKAKGPIISHQWWTLRRSEDDRGWGESQSLGSWRGGAEENSCDSQHWV